MKYSNFKTLITIFFIVVSIAFIYHKTSKFNYKRNIAESVVAMADSSYYIDKIEDTFTEEFQLVDLRCEDDYDISHIENAINIPFGEIISNKSIRILKKDTKPKLLYDANETEASAALSLLYQLGVENIKIIPGGYNNYLTNKDSLLFNSKERKSFDHKKYIKAPKKENEYIPGKVLKIVKTKQVEGGC